MAEQVVLRTGGQAFEGWLSASIQRTIEGPSAIFRVDLTEKHPSRPPDRRIRDGAAVAVELGAEPVVSGYIDRVEHRLDSSARTLTVSGRDRAADLVDCAPDLRPNEWRNITLDRLAQILAAPFGIAVRSEVSPGPAFAKVALNPGETAWSVLEERARYREAIVISDGRGGLVLTRPGGAGQGERLEEGRNILEGSLSRQSGQRFSDYIVKGQHAGSDSIFGPIAASPEGSARDEGVGRFRPLVLIASSGVDAGRSKERARFEATTRAARAERVTVRVRGWRQASGALWEPNLLSRVRAPSLGVNASLVVASATYDIDDDGPTTELSLLRPEAFTPDPEPVEDSEAGFQEF